MSIFTPKDRNRVRDHVLKFAKSDARVVAGAVIGSLANEGGDRWSDLDLTFAVADGVALSEVLEDWTQDLVAEFRAVQLFDLPAGATIYRVLLIPGCLQLDLSLTPEKDFAVKGPKFRQLFGTVVEEPFGSPPPAEELFGYAVHHAVRARFCIERGRYWQAEYWLSGLRDYALSLACRRRDLPAHYGRAFDDLPTEVHNTFQTAFACSLDRDELLRALRSAIAGLLSEAEEVRELAKRMEPDLQALIAIDGWESNRGR